MARESELRLIQSADHLLEVVIESLNRLQRKLQGETPSAHLLWYPVEAKATTPAPDTNTKKAKKPPKVYQPKDEEVLSDYIKNHLVEDLKDRGVILSREVQIRRGHGGAPGEDTDIHIDAPIIAANGRQSSDTVSIIIETKGCWNDKLDTAMKNQLVDRYIAGNVCRHGVYLVGWYNCTQWDPDDYQKKKSPQMDIATAQAHFDKQASALSKNGISIKSVVLDVALR